MLHKPASGAETAAVYQWFPALVSVHWNKDTRRQYLCTGTSVKMEQCSILRRFSALAFSCAGCHVPAPETGSCNMGLKRTTWIEVVNLEFIAAALFL